MTVTAEQLSFKPLTLRLLPPAGCFHRIGLELNGIARAVRILHEHTCEKRVMQNFAGQCRGDEFIATQAWKASSA